MNRIAAIGPKNIIIGLKSFGIDTFFALTPEEALKFLKELKTGSKHGVILVIKELLDGISKEDYQRLQADHLPVILAIPGLKANDKDYLLKLKKLAEKAVGSDILK